MYPTDFFPQPYCAYLFFSFELDSKLDSSVYTKRGRAGHRLFSKQKDSCIDLPTSARLSGSFSERPGALALTIMSYRGLFEPIFLERLPRLGCKIPSISQFWTRLRFSNITRPKMVLSPPHGTPHSLVVQTQPGCLSPLVLG